MSKTKIERLVLFNLNVGSCFTEMDFINKKSKKPKRLFQRKGRDENISC